MRAQYDAVIIGAGPAGIFAALELTKLRPEAQVLIVDRGRQIDRRSCPARTTGVCAHCKPCAIVNGWSGAGAFSDGKLSLSQEVGGHIADYLGESDAQKLVDYADSIYCGFGASDEIHGLNDKAVDEIKYQCSRHNIRLITCPVRHLGTDRAFDVLRAMYVHLVEKTHTEFSELSNATEILMENGKIVGVVIEKSGVKHIVKTGNVIVAPGRGGADWLCDIARKMGIVTENNEVDIGVRVEVPNSIMDHLTKPLYEAKMVYYSDTFENKVRTFCMNPGGVVSEEHYEGGIAVVNGHSYGDDSRKTENTNFALLVSSRFTEPFNQPIVYGKYIAQLGNMLTGGPIMVQRLGDLLKGRRTDTTRLNKSTTRPTLKTAVPGDLSFVLPTRHLTSIIEALKAFDKVAPGLYSRDTLLYGVEVKFYSSKIKVDKNFSTSISGLYAIGDGAGITRGLMQASVTGIVAARDIAARMA